MKKIVILFLLTTIILIGCSVNNESTSSNKLSIVTTNSISADMVSNIVLNKANVYSLVPIGLDPHQYEPLPYDIEQVSNADLIFYNGLNLETGNGWFDDLLSVTNKSDVAYALTKNVEPLYLSIENSKNSEDPHAWLDLENGIKYVELITEEIIKRDEENKYFYEINRDTYISKLVDLHHYAQTQIESIPKDQRTLITSEGAFKYFGQAYNIETAYIWEINTDAQGTPEQIQNILELIDERNVKSLFVETSINPSTMESVARESKINVHAKIFTDSLAKKGEIGSTYLEMMKWNIDSIVEGLK